MKTSKPTKLVDELQLGFETLNWIHLKSKIKQSGRSSLYFLELEVRPGFTHSFINMIRPININVTKF